jgi:hypothetical protein
VRLGRIENAENIFVAVLIVRLIDSANSQAQLVNGVIILSAQEKAVGSGIPVDLPGKLPKGPNRAQVWISIMVGMGPRLYGRLAFLAEARHAAILR